MIGAINVFCVLVALLCVIKYDEVSVNKMHSIMPIYYMYMFIGVVPYISRIYDV